MDITKNILVTSSSSNRSKINGFWNQCIDREIEKYISELYCLQNKFINVIEKMKSLRDSTILTQLLFVEDKEKIQKTS